MKLSACIVIYNGFDEALKAAQTILQYTRRYPLTLYLVDWRRRWPWLTPSCGTV